VTLWQRGPSISQRKDSLTVRGRAPSSSATSSPRCGAARSTQQAPRCQPTPGFPTCRPLAARSVAGTYRRRLTLTSGRFAMIDNALGFALVPWTPALDRHLGHHVAGVAKESGGIEWSFGRRHGLEI
jgi:hypothetical protein